MAVAGLVIAVVALCVAVAWAVLGAVTLARLRRASITQTAMILTRIDEIEGDLRQLSENGYVLARMLLEKGIVDEEEIEAAWKVFVEDARRQAREHAELVREWKERAEKDGVLVEELPKTTH